MTFDLTEGDFSPAHADPKALLHFLLLSYGEQFRIGSYRALLSHLLRCDFRRFWTPSRKKIIQNLCRLLISQICAPRRHNPVVDFPISLQWATLPKQHEAD